MTMITGLIKGYHVELTGNDHDVLIREFDNKEIARNEGLRFYDTIEEMTTPHYTKKDRKALEHFADYIGF